MQKLAATIVVAMQGRRRQILVVRPVISRDCDHIIRLLLCWGMQGAHSTNNLYQKIDQKVIRPWPDLPDWLLRPCNVFSNSSS